VLKPLLVWRSQIEKPAQADNGSCRLGRRLLTSKAYGVRRGKVSGRVWDTGVFVPNFSYGAPEARFKVEEPKTIYAVGRPNMKVSVVKSIQRALKEFGIDPGPINGEYGTLTAAAVGAFQATKGIVTDGQVGPQTARRLKIDLDS